MHSGFRRAAQPLPDEHRGLAARGRRALLREWPRRAADLRRIDAMWSEALAQSGGPFLFGAFGIADAFFAPVCVAPPHLRAAGRRRAPTATSTRVLAAAGDAGVDARRRAAEHDFLEFEDEPYRTPASDARVSSSAARARRRVVAASCLDLPHETLPRRRRGARCAARPAGQRPRLGRRRRRRPRSCSPPATSPVGTRLPGVPASADAARNTRSRAPSARPRAGYHGFAFHADPSVTLEEDLPRRDLTINAMARRTRTAR